VAVLVTAVVVTDARTNTSARSKAYAGSDTRRTVAVLVAETRANAGASLSDSSVSNNPSPLLIVRVESGSRNVIASGAAATKGRATGASVRRAKSAGVSGTEAAVVRVDTRVSTVCEVGVVGTAGGRRTVAGRRGAQRSSASV
jgi:hypothetical protein